MQVELQRIILKHCPQDQVMRLAWESAAFRKILQSPIVWIGRNVSLPDAVSVHVAKSLFKDYIDTVTLSDADEKTLAMIRGFSQLANVTFSGNSWVSDDALIAFLKDNGHHIQTLKLANCVNLTNKTILCLPWACPNLRELDISGNLFTSSALLALTELPKLESLSASNCLLLPGEAWLTTIGCLPNLEKIDLSMNHWVSYNFLTMLLPMTSAKQLNVCRCEDLTGYQVDRLRKTYPNITIQADPVLQDDSVESIRAYLLAIIRAH